MKVILIVIFCIAFSIAERTRWFQLENYSFRDYVEEYKKSYSSEEYIFRKKIFDDNLVEIQRHNQDKTKTWKKGVNHLTDFSEEEFKKLLGVKKQLLYASKAKQTVEQQEDISIEALPKHVDWREKNIVSAVKDQGRCGSCWTFGTAETIESHFAMANGELMDLSEQQILDCTPNPQQCGGTGGCSGGTAELAFTQIMKMGGLSSEWTYPYISYFGSNYNCQFNTSTTLPIAKLTGYTVLSSNVYAPLLAAVANKGPIAISVDASAWSSYESGVFNGCNQTNPDIDHEVQLVGYGTDERLGDYWLVRNSWSPLWGEYGYIRIHRTEATQCGVDLNPSDGTGCKNGPATVVVCGTCGILYDSAYPIIAK